MKLVLEGGRSKESVARDLGIAKSTLSKEKEVPYSRNRIAMFTKENKIMAKTKRRFKVTTRSNHEKTTAADLLQQEFMAEEKNQVWSSDIISGQKKAGCICQ